MTVGKASDQRVGIAGMGKMGSAVAARLSNSGYPVSAWSRSGVSPEKAMSLSVDAQPDISSLLASSDLIILSLFDDEAVTAVLNEMCRYPLTDKLIVDCSTVSPQTLRGLVGSIDAAGGRALDAPISGWPQMVSNGKAGLYVGGEDRDVAVFMPVAKLLSDRIHHVGGLGDGAAMKIVNNMMLGGYWQCLKEAMQVGKRAGLEPRAMLEILVGSPAANGSLAGKSAVILGQSDAVSFTADGIVGDLSLFTQTALELGVDAPAMSAALASYREFQAAGNGASDFAAMVREACNDV